MGDVMKDDFDAEGSLRKTLDIPCTRELHFIKQSSSNKLDVIVKMRSNDIIWGASAVNIFNYTFMQEYMAAILGLDVGNYFHFADNFHYYSRHKEMVEQLSEIKEVVDALERFAPLPLQESYDNAGLQVGLTEAEVSGALLCLDVTEKVIDEAVALGCNLVVSHHPLIFHGLKRIIYSDEVQRTVAKALKNDITVVSMHTNMDNANGGVNFKIAEKMGLGACRFFAGKSVDGIECGSGVIGELPEPLAADDFVIMLKRKFDVECVECNQLLRRSIKSVAVCGGAGSFLLNDAIAEGADAFVTGEMHYHEYFGHEQDIQIAVIGHYQSEQYTNEIFKSIISEKCKGVKTFLTKTNTNPILYL